MRWCHTHTHSGAEMGVKCVSESVSGVVLLGVGEEPREAGFGTRDCQLIRVIRLA